VPLLIEYEAVMTRPEHLRAARLPVRDAEALLDAFAAVAEPLRLAFQSCVPRAISPNVPAFPKRSVFSTVQAPAARR
jgi:hypothetical protein